MIDTYSIALSALVRDFHLEILHRSTDYDSIRITVEEVARPGLQLAGFFDHYEPMRLQIMGNVEMSFMAQLPQEERIRIYDRLFSYRFPAMLIARGIQLEAWSCEDNGEGGDIDNLPQTHNTTTQGEQP